MGLLSYLYSRLVWQPETKLDMRISLHGCAAYGSIKGLYTPVAALRVSLHSCAACGRIKAVNTLTITGNIGKGVRQL